MSPGDYRFNLDNYLGSQEKLEQYVALFTNFVRQECHNGIPHAEAIQKTAAYISQAMIQMRVIGHSDIVIAQFLISVNAHAVYHLANFQTQGRQ
jgi:hypothetical protein